MTSSFIPFTIKKVIFTVKDGENRNNDKRTKKVLTVIESLKWLLKRLRRWIQYKITAFSNI